MIILLSIPIFLHFSDFSSTQLTNNLSLFNCSDSTGYIRNTLGAQSLEICCQSILFSSLWICLVASMPIKLHKKLKKVLIYKNLFGFLLCIRSRHKRSPHTNWTHRAWRNVARRIWTKWESDFFIPFQMCSIAKEVLNIL